ncbi:MBL fold metallo-hydrolase [Aetokthonos hydrillicola Thurmond2011]|jgi:glyoxylase-like metal-dependent hydrolase (beta-lactamase superfamily II)/ferredoxin|uniref:MBL fold metallo-hydrolase n=1 Tax=Aetokthonos hydrillicola Thurmond2011 TaxID=2712845 RepID=A0AAP5IEB2_9CYAN|nr:MBL fold metallo-hydrolase [Aetokthonos hydrillicola]MBO3462034.1 MBL fold metallo-hydrolase [Aetokthonos hydrillicola CCALA 1050]MBW4589359.1 MBL fold metallo-hydrolase [Aetokthonos hydrillicola CCALA 1050]MDR9898108.1 MBL fold metallo-hydrolase [Aetokthonos hydrillicola Thurmond2011]
MARSNLSRRENVSGDFYVDTSCIDCDTCRWMAPQVFIEAGEQSAVYHQPVNDTERLLALQALLACPTSSIGTIETPKDIKAAQQTFPILIEENVYDCGYHSEKSYGATSYFIKLPEGNILVDSPRFAPPLVKQFENMGGIRYMYLTHRDDVADHRKFAEHFNCSRILHRDDITSGTQDVEIQLTGTESFELSPDLLIIPVPGHSKGHTVLLYKNRFLFTGDHLAWSDELNQLIAFRDYCWYYYPEQIKSMRKLANFSFTWVLPGHGRRYHADTYEIMTQQMNKCIQWMESA